MNTEGQHLGWRVVARMIDYTNLRPEATATQIDLLCKEAAEFGFKAVVVNPCHLELAVSRLRKTPVKVATVIGFPLGAMLTSAKEFETAEALRLGAHEIDMVFNIGALKSGDREKVASDIAAVSRLTHEAKAVLKVILETGLLTEDEKELACRLSVAAGAQFVKTSTGFLGGGATRDDVVLLRRLVGPHVGVKASGGIKTADDALAMIKAGANRLGTSSGVNIIRQMQQHNPS